MKLLLTCLALLTTTTLLGCGRDDHGPSAERTPVPVVVIGASLAAGTSSFIAHVNDDSEAFDDIYQYQDVLAALEPAWRVETFADMMFFTEPIGLGEELLAKALAPQRRIVLALDYLFWFGYGNHHDDSGEEGATRLAFLEHEGIPRLEQLWANLPDGTAPPFVLIGTLPDVRDSTVLSSTQKPSDDELAELNAAILAWATKHPHVLVVPYAERLAALKDGGEVRVGKQTYTKDDLPHLMLSDRLHPSTKGSAMMATLCLQTLHAAVDGDALVQSDPSKLDPRAIAEELVDARKAARQEAGSGKPVSAGSGR